ncbi:MAG: hypothetical protein U1E50_07440 [Caulobacteraceae bacterium]
MRPDEIHMWLEISAWALGLLAAAAAGVVKRSLDRGRRRRGEWSALQGVVGKFSEDADEAAVIGWANGRPFGGLISAAVAALQMLAFASWAFAAWSHGVWWLALILVGLFCLFVVFAFIRGNKRKPPPVRLFID